MLPIRSADETFASADHGRRRLLVVIATLALVALACTSLLRTDDGVSIFVPPVAAREHDDSLDDDFIVKRGRSSSHGHTSAQPAASLTSFASLNDDDDGDDSEVSTFVAPNSERSHDDSVDDDFIVKKGRSRSHGHTSSEPAPSLISLASLEANDGTDDDKVSTFVAPNSERSHDDSDDDDFVIKKGRSRNHGHGPSR